MGLIVEFDANGREQIDFNDLREKLLREGRGFTDRDLCLVPYSQLSLCAMANAGTAACDIALVRAEKKARRHRFVEMSPDAFAEVRRYLHANGLYTDVVRDRERRRAPAWESLSILQKTWFIMTCLNNHVDAPGERLREIENLLFMAGDAGLMPIQKASLFVDLIAQLVTGYPHAVDAEMFRAYISGQAEELMQFMPETERETCANEILSNYSCTSDCFQPYLSGVIS